MMKVKNKKINVILIIAVITIWGVIGVKVISYLINKNESGIEKIEDVFDNDKTILKNETSNSNLKYVRISRDPFLLGKIQRNLSVDNSSIDNVKQNQPEALKFHIKGILFSKKKKIVTIFNELKNETVFLKEGNKYESIKIIRIEKYKIKYSENGSKKEMDFGEIIK